MTPRDMLAISQIAAIDGSPDWDWAWAENLVRENRDAAHDGDCTQRAHTCTRCVVDEAFWFADHALAILADAGFAVVPVEPTEAAPDYAPSDDNHDACWEWCDQNGVTCWLTVRVEDGEIRTLYGSTRRKEERVWQDLITACLYLHAKRVAPKP